MKKVKNTGSIPNFLVKSFLKANIRRKAYLKKINISRTLDRAAEEQVKREARDKHSVIKGKPQDKRARFLKKYYGKLPFWEKIKETNVYDEFGIESDVDKFASISMQILNGYPEEVIVNLKNCQRIWPSGVMLLCSYYHWIELKAKPSKVPAKITARSTRDSEISKYFDYCGLRKYFTHIEPPTESSIFDPSRVVKVEHETHKEKYNVRIEEIFKLVKDNTKLNNSDLKRFKSIILGELFINLSEHGVNYRHSGYKGENLGWYAMAQVHEKSGFISICLADNGIGIANSLLTGPLRKLALKKIGMRARNSFDEGKYIKLALEKNMSGAVDASNPEMKMFGLKESYSQGRHRGMGFSRLTRASEKLGIEVHILSNKGYLKLDRNGKLTTKTYENRIFAGTLFNLIIPLSGKGKSLK